MAIISAILTIVAAVVLTFQPKQPKMDSGWLELHLQMDPQEEKAWRRRLWAQCGIGLVLTAIAAALQLFPETPG
jgi:hypothetical protein